MSDNGPSQTEIGSDAWFEECEQIRLGWVRMWNERLAPFGAVSLYAWRYLPAPLSPDLDFHTGVFCPWPPPDWWTPRMGMERVDEQPR